MAIPRLAGVRKCRTDYRRREATGVPCNAFPFRLACGVRSEPGRACHFAYARPGTIEIAGQRVAFLICYEQLLVLPVLLSAIDHPTLIVGMANQYWVRDTTIPAAQRASLVAWSRLFALPLLIAENR